jgi:hypothetical protein
MKTTCRKSPRELKRILRVLHEVLDFKTKPLCISRITGDGVEGSANILYAACSRPRRMSCRHEEG